MAKSVVPFKYEFDKDEVELIPGPDGTLKTTSKVDYCLRWIRHIDNNELPEIRVQREKAMDAYFLEKRGDEIDNRSQLVTSDIQDAVEWLMPSFMKYFAASDEVTLIKPQSRGDVDAAVSQTELVNHQMRVRNDWFSIIHDTCKDCLMLKNGAIMYEWEEKTEIVEKEYENLDEMTFVELTMQPGAKIVKDEIVEGNMHNVTVQYEVKDEGPRLWSVPQERLGYPATLRNIEDYKFLYYREQLPLWEIRQRWGDTAAELVKDCEKDLLTSGDDGESEVQARFKDLNGVNFLRDKKMSDDYWVYRCWYREPLTGKHWITVICGDVLLWEGENKYNKPNIRIGMINKLPHRIVGRSVYDIIKDLWDTHTVLKRQILDNIYTLNVGRWKVNEDLCEAEDVANRNFPGGWIRVQDMVNSIMPLDVPQLPPWINNVLESVIGDKENRIGITRLNQGTDPNSLNKTARGINALMTASQQRIDLMGRVIAEVLVAPLVKDLVDCNIKFMKKSTAVRIVDDFVEIHPSHVVGKFDIVVDVALGTGTKDMIISRMQQLLGLAGQLLKGGMGAIISPDNMYNMMKELVKAMEYRDPGRFVTDPQYGQKVKDLVKTVLMTVMQLEPMLQANPQAAQIFGPIAQQAQALLQSMGAGGADVMKELEQMKKAMMQQQQQRPPQARGGERPGSGASVMSAPGSQQFKGQNRPEQPEREVQPLNPRLTPDGGGFHA